MLEETLDQVLMEFSTAGVEAVILDASINFGGYDRAARAVAARFTDRPVSVYAKEASDARAPIRTRVRVDPAKGPRFTGPVWRVTTDATVSAGEILTMALRAMPNVSHVGQPTAGALSDVMEKTLPNGWVLG